MYTVHMYVRMYRVGQKTRLFLRVDNFTTVSCRKACDMSKVSKFYLGKKYEMCMSVNLSIFCLICINLHCT